MRFRQFVDNVIDMPSYPGDGEGQTQTNYNASLNDEIKSFGQYLKVSTISTPNGQAPFETMVFIPDTGSYEPAIVRWYNTQEEATGGHAQLVQMLKTLPLRQVKNQIRMLDRTPIR